MFVVHNNYGGMEFVDRIEETARLKEVLAEEKPSFVVVAVLSICGAEQVVH